MRVIAGKFRNRNLKISTHFRATTDRVRETLFNILQNDLEGTIFVDAFAGSGAVGIEALSRGASMVYFVESNRKSLQILESNLLHCCENAKWRILATPVKKGMEVIHGAADSIGIVFLDPPYDFDSYSEILELSGVLFPTAAIVLEASTRVKIITPSNLDCFREKKIGETLLSFYKVR